MLDLIDRKILRILSQDGAATATQIGAAVGLSIPAVNKRIQKLRQGGVIRNFTLLTDRDKVGKPILAYVLMVVASADSERFLSYVDRESDILECHAVSGEYDYLVKVCAEDVQALENKLLCLKKQKGVIKSHTMLCLMEHKSQYTILPDIPEDE
ncbi:MAG: Lrp/AsnC family transcriptional regulator [Oscillospiraceae bacterium]|nr:Lrp/AsnC family transcriptional regulator [Oscillospiraceae bacterium]